MKRLIKKALHDILNRDCAIVMIGDEFYEDVTHAACLKQYLDKHNDNNINIQSYQYRPSTDVLIEIAMKEKSYVTLGHKAAKDDGVYLIYAIKPDGEMVEYDGIPQSIKDKFENNYNLEVRNEMDHDGDYENNNPYIDDAEELENNFQDRMFELSGDKEVIEKIKNDGYEVHKTKGNNFFVKDGVAIIYDMQSGIFMICAFGEDILDVEAEELLEFAENLRNEERLKFLIDIHSNFTYGNDIDEISCEFKNINGFNIKLEHDGDGIHIYDMIDLNNNDITSEIEDILDDNGSDSQNLQLNDLQFLYNYGGEE